MTESQEVEFNVLGCKVKVQPNQNDGQKAKAVIDFISAEIEQLRSKRPMLRDTDLAVLVALKMATEKIELEDEYKKNIFKLEESLELALSAIGPQTN
jgi:cell division protein ZapA (FtsZ GTPase activity inhibitor)